MKRWFGFLLCLVMVLTLLGSLPSCEKKPVLNIFNWGQYIADGEDGCMDVIKEFE